MRHAQASAVVWAWHPRKSIEFGRTGDLLRESSAALGPTLTERVSRENAELRVLCVGVAHERPGSVI